MTNFEYYKEEILELANKSYPPMLNKGKIELCDGYDCSDCKNCEFDNDEIGCIPYMLKWLYAEHKEQPKLTKKERQFCELLETGWIARDKNGVIHVRDYKPVKMNTYWTSRESIHSWNLIGNCFVINKELFNTPFSFITWDDAEPWSIEDLLKLEVEE